MFLNSTVPGTQMTYRQMEEQINKWMSELDNQERVFLQQATLVNAWDRLLVDNGEKVVCCSYPITRRENFRLVQIKTNFRRHLKVHLK